MITLLLTVTKKELTLRATDYLIEYDEEAPDYTGTYEGFYGTDTASVVSGTPVYICAYVKGGDSGDYTIAVDVSGLSAANYSFVGASGILTVNKGVLTFTFGPITENGYDYIYNGRSKEVAATLASGMCRTDVLTSFTLKYYRQYVTDGGVTDVMYDRFFLQSIEEVYGAPQIGGAEGPFFPYWKQVTGLDTPANGSSTDTNPARQIRRISNPSGSATNVRLRSAHRGTASHAWYVGAAGYLSYYNASTSFAALPACVIS